jgi:hypothetical protein
MPTAIRRERTFRLEYSVATRIAASPERVWAVLTEIEEWARWTATITSIEGEMSVGNKVKLRVPGVDRTFGPKVAALEPNRRLVWSDGAAPMFKGTRTYTLAPSTNGTTDFAMVEVFTGILLPLIKKSLPDFRPPFERFTADLGVEAERKR